MLFRDVCVVGRYMHMRNIRTFLLYIISPPTLKISRNSPDKKYTHNFLSLRRTELIRMSGDGGTGPWRTDDDILSIAARPFFLDNNKYIVQRRGKCLSRPLMCAMRIAITV